jgi:hypothetical protein
MNEHPTIPEPVNVMVRALLRSPLHWTMSRNTMLLAVTGRKTQRVYQVPVSYSVDGPDLVGFTDAPWWKHLARHLRVVPRDAKYHGVRLERGHEPNAADLASAAHTTAMIRIRFDEPR